MWCWMSGLEFHSRGRTGCNCWKGKGRGKSTITSGKTLKIVNRTKKGKRLCPDKNIKWTKVLVGREQMGACSFQVIGKTDKERQQISILTMKGKIHNNKREVKWEKGGSDWFITACTLGNHHLLSFQMILRVTDPVSAVFKLSFWKGDVSGFCEHSQCCWDNVVDPADVCSCFKTNTHTPVLVFQSCLDFFLSL